MAEKKKWVMPEWMEQYRPLFVNTGGNTVEELMNRLNEEGLAFSNSVVFTLACGIYGQIGLLQNLYEKNLLSPHLGIGNFVKFNSPAGSVGKITGVHSTIPNYFYVEWVYGRDKNGDVIKSSASVLNSEITIISAAQYNTIRDRKGF